MGKKLRCDICLKRFSDITTITVVVHSEGSEPKFKEYNLCPTDLPTVIDYLKSIAVAERD